MKKKKSCNSRDDAGVKERWKDHFGDLMFQNKAEEQKIRSTLSPEQIKELNGEYYSYLHLLIKEVEQYEKRVVYKRIDRFNYVVAIQ